MPELEGLDRSDVDKHSLLHQHIHPTLVSFYSDGNVVSFQSGVLGFSGEEENKINWK